MSPAGTYEDDATGSAVFGLGSSWEPLVRVAQRTAVLRCPGDGRVGAWEDDPLHAAAHAQAVSQRGGGGKAGEDVQSGVEIDAKVGQIWVCATCARETRRPRVGRISSTTDCRMTGHGSCMDTNAAEDAMLRHIDSILPILDSERP